MRKIFISLLAAGALFMAAPAQSHDVGTGGGTFVFVGAAPCAVACSYWVDNGYTPCENPFPPGAFQDKLTNGAPTPGVGQVVVLEVHFESAIDWDSFMCENATGPARVLLATGANSLTEPCDNITGNDSYVPIGCNEDMSVLRTAGQKAIIRGYNWSDVGPANGRWGYLVK